MILARDDFIEYVKSLKPTKIVGRKNKYYNLYCSFDIETTSTIIDGQKFAFVYAAVIAAHTRIGQGEGAVHHPQAAV